MKAVIPNIMFTPRKCSDSSAVGITHEVMCASASLKFFVGLKGVARRTRFVVMKIHAVRERNNGSIMQPHDTAYDLASGFLIPDWR
jgi:hypothetical protein